MLRRMLLTVAVVTGLLVVAVAVLVAFRVALVEALVSSRLAALGIPAVRLTVESLDFRHLAIVDVALGSGAELRADSVTLAYRPGALISGRLDGIFIDGFRLRLDLSGARQPLGSLQPLIEGGDGSLAPAAMPETISLTRGRIEAATSSGDVAAAVSGRWRPLAGTAFLTLSDFTLPQIALDTSRLEVAVTSDRIDTTAMVRGHDDALDLDLSATIGSWRGEPTLALDLDGSLAPARWRVSPQPAAGPGTISMSLHLGGRLQPINGLSRDLSAVNWIFGAHLGGLLDASLTDVAWRDRAEGISGQLSLAVTMEEGSVQVESAGDGFLSVARLDSAWLDATGAAAVLPQLRDAGLTISSPSRNAPLRVRIRPVAEGVDVALSGSGEVTMAETALTILMDGSLALDKALSLQEISVSQADLRLRDLTVAGHRFNELHLAGKAEGRPDDLEGIADITGELAATQIETVSLGGATLDIAAEFHWSDRRLDIRQRGNGSASVVSADLGGAARIARPFGLVLSGGLLTLDVTPDGPAASHAISVLADPVAIELPRARAAPLVLQVEIGPVRLEGAQRPGEGYRSQISLADGYLAIPEDAISAQEISVSVTLAAASAEPLAQFTVGRLAHTATPAYFAPLRLQGQVNLNEDMLELTAAGTGDGGGFELSMRGRHRFADGRGSVRIEMPKTAFREDALQPAQLSPLLRDMGSATGRVGAVAEIAWGPAGVSGKGTFELADVSFTADTTTVEGLDTSITLDGLFPVSTGSDQRLSVRRIDPAVPVEDVAARFRVEPVAPPRLRVNEVTGRFAGGQLRVGEVLIDPSRPRHAFTIGVDGIDLAILLGLMNVEGVSGTGHLSGDIPVAVADGSVIVENGQLAAVGPGMLRVRSDAATSAFAGAGEQVVLMLQALEDFRYESLSATLNIDADGTAAAKIRMLGNNPAVLEGYPFAFNIELSGNAADLLVALRQGAQISSDLVRPAVR